MNFLMYVESIIKILYYKNLAAVGLDIIKLVIDAVQDVKTLLTTYIPSFSWPDECVIKLPYTNIGFDIEQPKAAWDTIMSGASSVFGNLYIGAVEILNWTEFEDFLDSILFSNYLGWLPITKWVGDPGEWETRQAKDWDPDETPAISDIMKDIAFWHIMIKVIYPALKAVYGKIGKLIFIQLLKLAVALTYSIPAAAASTLATLVNALVPNQTEFDDIMDGINDLSETLAELPGDVNQIKEIIGLKLTL